MNRARLIARARSRWDFEHTPVRFRAITRP